MPDFSRPGMGKWLLIAIGLVLLDQGSKQLVSSQFVLGESRAVTGFFNLALAHNFGASFSMLGDAGGWQRWFFSAIAVGASVWIIWLLRKHAEQKLFCWALSLILSGALGNLVDRLAYGYVIDFLDFHWNEYHFATFNIADTAINIGAALLILDGFKNKSEKNNGTVAG